MSFKLSFQFMLLTIIFASFYFHIIFSQNSIDLLPLQAATLVVSEEDFIHPLARHGLMFNKTVPGPILKFQVNTRVEITVINTLSNANVAIHWHGLDQRYTPGSDGVASLIQCPIAPGTNMTYSFPLLVEGTYWYHAQLDQTVMGLYGAFIVEGLSEPATTVPDQILVIGDWYNTEIDAMNDWYLNSSDGNEPIPDAIIVNGKFNNQLQIQANKNDVIRFRIINTGPFSMYNFSIDGLSFILEGLDATTVLPIRLPYIILNVGQRATIRVDFNDAATWVKSATAKSIYFRASILSEMYPVEISQFQPGYLANYSPWLPYTGFNLDTNYFGIIQFDGNTSISIPTYGPTDVNYSEPPPTPVYLTNFDTNVLNAVPFPNDPAPSPTHFLTVTIEFNQDANGVTTALWNGRTLTETMIAEQYHNDPILHQVMRGAISPLLPPSNTNQILYDQNLRVYALPADSVVEITIVNYDGGEHPIHMHSHTFWIIGTSEYNITRPDSNYMKRDVVSVPANGYAKIRIKSDQPGVWFFHCHISFHLAAGLAGVVVEAPEKLRQMTIPSNQLEMCSIQKTRELLASPSIIQKPPLSSPVTTLTGGSQPVTSLTGVSQPVTSLTGVSQPTTSIPVTPAPYPTDSSNSNTNNQIPISSATSSDGGERLEKGVFAILVLGCVLFVLQTIGILIWCCLVYRKKRELPYSNKTLFNINNPNLRNYGPISTHSRSPSQMLPQNTADEIFYDIKSKFRTTEPNNLLNQSQKNSTDVSPNKSPYQTIQRNMLNVSRSNEGIHRRASKVVVLFSNNNNNNNERKGPHSRPKPPTIPSKSPPALPENLNTDHDQNFDEV